MIRDPSTGETTDPETVRPTQRTHQRNTPTQATRERSLQRIRELREQLNTPKGP